MSDSSVTAIAEAMAGLPELTSISHSYLEPASPGSRADQMLSDELGACAFHIASTSLASALDHLTTMKRVFETALLPPYALYALARSAHEGALVAEWLMEPRLAIDDHFARSVGAQFDDYGERSKLEQAANIRPKGSAELAVTRRAQFMAKAHARGLARPNAKSGELEPTRPLLGITNLFDRFESHDRTLPDGSVVKVSGSVLFRAYSAFAHGKQWANLLGRLEPVTAPDANRHQIAVVIGSDAILERAYVAPTAAARRALDAIGVYRSHSNWPADPLP